MSVAWGGDGDRREVARRAVDEARYWLPLVLSLASTLLLLGALYGHIGGRLELIEYRLTQIELLVRQPH